MKASEVPYLLNDVSENSMKRTLFWGLACIVLVSLAIRLLANPQTPQNDGFPRAAGQPGYDEVKTLGSNPVAGDASVAESEWFLFNKHCVGCHASADNRAKFQQAGIDLSNSNQYKFGWGDLGIFRSIKYGFAKSTAHRGISLSDRDTWILVKYLRRLQVTNETTKSR